MKVGIKNKYFRFYLLIQAIIAVNIAIGQDIQFSQFYAAALYQNPAFAGSTHHHRGTFHQRLQWPGLDAKYTTSLLSFDTYANKYNSGFGVMVFKDWQGSSTINSIDAGVQYAYEIHFNEQISFRPGLQLSYVSRNLDYSGLTLPEDYTNNGYVGGSNLNGNSRKGYVDISSGGIFYSEKLWVGVSAHHLNMPNQSFIGDVSRLPIKFALTAGYKIPLIHSKFMAYMDHEKDKSITPTVHYKFQGKSDQLDLGLYANYDFVMVGFWYRGIPVKHYEKGLHNNESMVAMVGWKYEAWTVTYSYDFVVSRLSRARTGGAHELNLTYVYSRHKHYKPMKRLPCPTFHHK